MLTKYIPLKIHSQYLSDVCIRSMCVCGINLLVFILPSLTKILYWKRDHGGPLSDIRHVGDLGNIEADATGAAVVRISDRHVTLVGPNSAIGRAIVVHATADDLGLGGDAGSVTTGNAGGRVGCGVIGRA